METTLGRRGVRLTPVDAAWMRMDEPANPMMTTGMLLLDGPIDRRRLVRVFRRVLPRHPRFLQRIQPGRTGPRWVPDAAFDADEHVQSVRVRAPGDEAALRRLIASLMSSSLVSEGAMWSAHVVDGLADGRGALIFRLRHAVADGPALLNVMADLTDARRAGHRAGDAASFFGPNGAPAPLPLLATAGATGPRAVVTAGMQAVGGLTELLRVVTGPPDRATALRGDLGPSKAPGWTDPIALDRFRPIRRVTGATVNDILLSCTAGGIRRHLLERGEPVDGLELRGMVPVNLTALSARSDAGNHFGLVYLTLPVGIEDPFARLHATRRCTERIKASGEAPVSYAVLGAVGLLPPEIVAPTLGFFGSRATAVITNVPGPPAVRYLAGRRIDEIVFWVPQAARLGLGISLMSYAGSVMVGIAADAGLVPRPQRLANAIEAEFRALEREVAPGAALAPPRAAAA
jgi:diacylglycerol O-acyltransferase